MSILNFAFVHQVTAQKRAVTPVTLLHCNRCNSNKWLNWPNELSSKSGFYPFYQEFPLILHGNSNEIPENSNTVRCFTVIFHKYGEKFQHIDAEFRKMIGFMSRIPRHLQLISLKSLIFYPNCVRKCNFSM
jgi:hypothetical protein